MRTYSEAEKITIESNPEFALARIEELERNLAEALTQRAELMRRLIPSRALYIRGWREAKGFEMPESLEDANGMLAKLMLVSCEVAEAAEDIRKGDLPHFREELADIVIRCLDIAGSFEIDLEAEIDRKMRINEARPYRHGKLA